MALFNEPQLRRPGFRLALVAVGLAVVVVMLGAFTRLMDAGLGCPDWPGCYGHLLWPNESHEIARAQQLYPDSPVEGSKTWPEMVHRYFAGSLGLLILVLAIQALRHRRAGDQPLALPLLLLFLVVWQALFGMWTVTLKLWPQVVTMHLLGGMSILSLLWLLALRLDNRHWTVQAGLAPRLETMKPLVIAAIALVVMQICLGGWTTSNYAAFACPDFPTCRDRWLPPMDLAHGFNIFQTIGPNYLGGLMESEGRVAIHFVHRLGALVTAAGLIYLCSRLLALSYGPARRMALVIACALLLQISLGISNVLLQFPLAIAVAHNLGGALLLLVLVTLGARVWMVRPKTVCTECTGAEMTIYGT